MNIVEAMIAKRVESLMDSLEELSLEIISKEIDLQDDPSVANLLAAGKLSRDDKEKLLSIYVQIMVLKGMI